MKEQVIGFLILRKPESMGDVEPYNRIFKIDDKFYSGIERSHLNDLIDDYFKKKLSPELSDIIRRNFEESNNSFYCTNFIRNFGEARKVFDYLEKNNLNELTVIQSQRIMDGIGYSEIDSSLISWLGYDLTIMQRGSLIFQGVYFKPHLFAKWIKLLNKNGLFDNLDDCANYFDDYLKAAILGEVEDHLVLEENSEPIRIGRINTESID